MSLRLKTLGRLEIRWLDQPVITLTLRKSQALLVYLAMASDPQDRSRLAGLLWGELPEENARRNLRHALHTLRQVLVPDFIESNRLIAGLSSSYPCHVDALDFEASLTLAARRRKAGELDASVTHLEAAVSLYQGDFLDSFDVAESLEFEAWSASQRAQLRMHFLEALDFLVTYWTQRGVYERALRYARRQLLAEPLWEKSHRQMMTLLALTGQRSAALSQYQACRRILAGELGLEPLEETTALYRSIQSSNYPASSGNGMAFREAAVDALPFVGREAEHARLADRWDAARRGNGGLTLGEGEAGVGKTRLVDEVLRFVELQGATVVRGRCYEFGGGVPYQPIAEALRAHLHAAPPVVEPLWLAELSRLLPDVRQVYPDLPDTQHTMGETARQRLFEAVARFLRASLKPRSALCFFLDDLHWADVATLDLLHYLVRHLIEMPVWFVGAYRPEEAPLSHPLARLRQGLSRDRRATRLVLEPLSGASVDALAHTLVGRNDEDALGDFLYRESAGNAFMLMETVRALQERGALVAQEHDFHGVRQTLDEGGRPAWRWTGPPSAALLPVTVQDIILQRVGRLSEAAQRLLTLAAVLGQPFDLAFLQAAGRDAGHVSESLDEWLARRLVRAQPHASCVRYDFSHDKVRAVIYHTTLPALRQQLHFRVGEALEHLPLAGEAQEGQNVAGVLAYHWEQAGEPERALPYLMHAGDQARQVYAHREAAGYYRRALALLEDLGDARREERARTLMKLGLAHHYAFDYGEARRAYEAG
ncbi:MAG: AAA family ATPase, partial [Anaerolineae bacterium]|nr:AAA family ATPase [Anaerolineae bacterium]